MRILLLLSLAACQSFVVPNTVGIRGGSGLRSNSARMAVAAPQTGNAFKWLTDIFSFSKASVPKDAVLVIGASGRAGREVVKELLASGRSVVAAGRTQSKITEALGDAAGARGLWVKEGLDVTAEEIPETFFEGVTQVVSCLGPSFSDPALNAEAVDYRGNAAVLRACERAGLASTAAAAAASAPLCDFASGASLPEWAPLDDVIMGGKSSSAWDAAAGDRDFARWSGELVTDGGGFCGTVVKKLNFDTAGYDGIRLVVRGDGSRFKFRLKPADMAQANEYQYQASFDTVDGAWVTAELPFSAFTAVRRNDVIYAAPPVDKGPSGTKMSSIGIVLSRFEYNEYANYKCKPGPFSLDVRAIELYRHARPAVVLVSSAGAERVNRLTAEERAKDIPIVQLNPQGILNWKFKAETALRTSGVPYAIVRAAGLLPGAKGDGPRLLQLGQADRFSGRITRAELAKAVAATLNSPHATGKTFEVRRDESEDAAGVDPLPTLPAQLAALVPDRDRAVRALPPFPAARDPPPPPDAAGVQAILSDPRVRAQQARDGKGAE
ncbi:NADH:ubiquinone oxidoreductase complex I [Tribonema minus]|uniref:NADH:ubiquinone oxidoreductase complex I n=1 Tax=Tribonema minus TaxID=303371 RepID=A0A836CBF4_9STRA|nr:NADH:ubiquinone oxidoreductase complex I [Tribonema minus]